MIFPIQNIIKNWPLIKIIPMLRDRVEAIEVRNDMSLNRKKKELN